MTIVTFTAPRIVSLLLGVPSYNGSVCAGSLPASVTLGVGSPLGSASWPACPLRPTLCSSSLAPFSRAVTCHGVLARRRCRERYPVSWRILGWWHRRRRLGRCAVVGSRATPCPAVTEAPRYVSPLTSTFTIQTFQILRPDKLTTGSRTRVGGRLFLTVLVRRLGRLEGLPPARPLPPVLCG